MPQTPTDPQSDAAPGTGRADGAAAEQVSTADPGRIPRTPRGERTRRRILNAALEEFGTRGFAETSIVSITRRAKVALGTFYTYFESKEALFGALVGDMSNAVRSAVAPALAGAGDALEAERAALEAYLGFVAGHQQVYRIVDEAEFVDPAAFRAHYETTAARIRARLADGAGRGQLRRGGDLDDEVRAWAVMGMNVFLGLRFGVWGEADPAEVATIAGDLLAHGLAAPGQGDAGLKG